MNYLFNQICTSSPFSTYEIYSNARPQSFPIIKEGRKNLPPSPISVNFNRLFKVYWREVMLDSYQEILYSEWDRKRKKNPRYSLRAFARDLDISSSKLSEIFNKKQGLSKEKADTIATKLRFNREKKLLFINLVEAACSRSKVLREKASENVDVQKRIIEFTHVSDSADTNDIIRWHYQAIRRLTQSSSFKEDPEWIGKMLNIDENLAKEALYKLLKLGYLKRDKDNRIHTDQSLTLINTGDVKKRKELLLERFEELFSKAMKTTKTHPPEERFHCTHLFSLKKSQIPKIKEYIRELEDKIDDETYETGEPEVLYGFGAQLFPLSEKIE